MEIRILTTGSAEETEIFINGKKLENILEFTFTMNPTRRKKVEDNKFIELKGRCKMTQMYDGDYRSYYFEDFKKVDEAGNGGN